MGASVLTTVAGGVAEITLNRPEKRNALDRATIAALSSELEACAGNAAVRLVQITGAGNVFGAGADLTEMQAQAHASEAANLAHAEQLAAMLAVLSWIPCRSRPWRASTGMATAERSGRSAPATSWWPCRLQNSPSPRCASGSSRR